MTNFRHRNHIKWCSTAKHKLASKDRKNWFKRKSVQMRACPVVDKATCSERNLKAYNEQPKPQNKNYKKNA